MINANADLIEVSSSWMRQHTCERTRSFFTVGIMHASSTTLHYITLHYSTRLDRVPFCPRLVNGGGQEVRLGLLG